MRVNTGYINSTRSNPLFLCDVLGALINCLVCWFYTGALALALFLVVFNSWRGKRVRSGRDWSQHPESLISSDDVDAFGQDVATRCQMALLRLFPPHSRLLSEFDAPYLTNNRPLWSLRSPYRKLPPSVILRALFCVTIGEGKPKKRLAVVWVTGLSCVEGEKLCFSVCQTFRGRLRLGRGLVLAIFIYIYEYLQNIS